MPSLRRFVLPLLVAAACALRLGVVAEFHAPAGDGLGYHQLAHELRRAGRYAYTSWLPPTYARMPGWPLVLAAIHPPVDRDAVHAPAAGARSDLEVLLVRATRLNVLLDVGTSVLVWLLAREMGLGAVAAGAAFWLALLCPLFILNSCYLLRESLSTTLAAGALYLAARGYFRRNGRALVGAALVIGVGMLVRFDLLALGLACVPGWLRLDGARRKVAVAGAAVAVCAAAFSPWPLRNYHTFGHFFPAREVWNDVDGNPIPLGARAWISSWVDDLDEDWINFRLVHRKPIQPADLDPRSYDSPAERAELEAILGRYNVEWLSPSVDEGFRALAMRRFRERPVQRLLWLPLERAALWWWHFPPEQDQPLRSRLLGQPRHRLLLDAWSQALAVAGLCGFVLLLGDGRTRRFAAALLAMAWLRAMVICLVAPDGGGQRYLAPTYPVLLVGVAALVPGIQALARRARARSNEGPQNGAPESPAKLAE